MLSSVSVGMGRKKNLKFSILIFAITFVFGSTVVALVEFR